MGELRKVYIAVECENDQEKELVQELAKEISNMRVLKANSILRMVPMFQKHRNELIELFNMVANGGLKSIFSVRAGILIRKLSSNN